MSQFFAEEDSKPIPDAYSLITDVPSYSPIRRIHHVILHLPLDIAPGAPGEERNQFVENWLNNRNYNKIRKALAVPDDTNPEGYTWQDRGWSDETTVLPQIKASLKRYGSCILARKLNFEEAIRLQRRLSNATSAFLSSAIVLHLGSDSRSSSDDITCSEDPSHGIRTTNVSSCIASISCPLCECQCNAEMIYTCEVCYAVQSCQLCYYLRRSAAPDNCSVFAGHLAGTRTTYPPQDAAIEARNIVLQAKGEDPAIQDRANEEELRRLLAAQYVDEISELDTDNESAAPVTRAPPAADTETSITYEKTQERSVEQMAESMAEQMAGRFGGRTPSFEEFYRHMEDTGEMGRMIPGGIPSFEQFKRSVEASGRSISEFHEQFGNGLRETGSTTANPPATRRVDPQTRSDLTPEQQRRFDELGFHAFRNVAGQISVIMDGSRHAGISPSSIPGFNEAIRALGGTPIDAGTDSPLPIPTPGTSMHTEVRVSGGGGSTSSTSSSSSSRSGPAAGLGRDSQSIISRYFKNKKPKTKKSVLDTLPKSTYVPEEHEGQTDCIMCQGQFTTGDSIVTLPCKHIFHAEGPKSEDCADCPLLTDWLKKNNDCPICRDKLPHEEIKDGWQCPLCEKDIRAGKDSCTDCNLQSRVALLAEDDDFDRTEKLFLEISEYRLNKQRGMDDDHLYVTLTSKIDETMNSSDIAGLVGRNWDVAIGVRMLLDQNMTGRFDFDACVRGIDTNSANLIRIWIKRVVAKNKEVFPDDTLANTKEAPKPKPRVSESSDWRCCLCSAANRAIEDKCCNCDASNGAYKQKLAPHTQRVFSQFCDLALRGFRLTQLVKNGTVGESDQTSIRSSLKRDITTFLDSSSFMDPYDNAGYMVKRHLKAFFNRMLRYEVRFPFMAEGYNDINSVASYANFIHELRETIERTVSVRGIITVDRPNSETIQYGESFEPFSDHRNPVPRNSRVERIVTGNKEIILLMCRKIAFGTTASAWAALDSFFDAMVEFPIRSAVVAIKGGMRDLDTLVYGLSSDTKFFVEAILRKVKQYELQRSFCEVDDILTYGSPRLRPNSLMISREGNTLMERQHSICTDTRSAFQSLKGSGVSAAEFAEVLIFLYKIVKNINGDANKLEYRRISKENSKFKRCIGSHPAALSVLQFIGFLDSPTDPTRLYLRELNRDHIARCCKAMSDIAVEDGISLS